MDDYWMKHIHLKITDRCNAACPFCIEQNSHIKENKEQFLTNVKRLLDEMDAQGHLATVSITGGEPALCDYVGDVVDMVKSHNCFLNINTTFSRFITSNLQPSWLNISCHRLGPDAHCHLAELQGERIAEYRKINPDTKIRIQCVLHEKGLKNIDEMLDTSRRTYLWLLVSQSKSDLCKCCIPNPSARLSQTDRDRLYNVLMISINDNNNIYDRHYCLLYKEFSQLTKS